MEEVLSFITRFLLGLVAVLATIEFVRHRDRTRLDIMLMLASLGVPVVLAATGLNQTRWLQTLAGMAVVAQPYLLLRLMEDFRPVPRAIVIAGAIGMALSWVALIVWGSPRPAAVTLSIIAYFVLFESYAIVVLFRGAVFTRGVSKWRYGLAAAGSALLAATLLLIGVGLAAPGLLARLELVRGVLPILAGVAYYLAFIPPVWLRHAWQLPEIREFLRIAAGHPARERADLLLN